MENDQQIQIKEASQQDAETLTYFNTNNALETENMTLDPETALLGVKYVLNNPEKGFYLIAEKQGKIIGSLMITTEWSDWRNGDFWWIQSVYVLPEGRKQGAYKLLYRYVKSIAAQKGNIRGIRLYVEKNNQVAQNTYLALGMKDSDYFLFEEKI
jgi:ribosomal protein S18 acetylase RimI-like enzyme